MHTVGVDIKQIKDIFIIDLMQLFILSHMSSYFSWDNQNFVCDTDFSALGH